MHYLKCYTFLFLIIPTLFLAGLYNSVSFGATDKPQITTPSKIICCKDDTYTSSDSVTSLASPLKKRIRNRPNTMKQLKQRKPILLQLFNFSCKPIKENKH